jgi:hypothetical protein
MPIPQVADRIKEAPAVVLRALFAGVGQLLMAADKLRGRVLEAGGHTETPPGPGLTVPEPTPAQPPAASQPPPAQTTAGSAASAMPVAPAPASAEPAPAVPVPVAPADPVPAEPSPAAAATPPIPQYDELSVASLRARMRAFDTPAMRELIAYERAHAGREAVIAMFERRLAKLSEEGR